MQLHAVSLARTLITAGALIVSVVALGQKVQVAEPSANGVSFGAGAGFSRNFFADLTLARTRNRQVSYFRYGSSVYGGTEVYFGRQVYLAPKAGFWIGEFLGYGASALYYTDFKQGRLVLRPEVGFGDGLMKVYYGYNIRLGSGFDQIQGSVFGITWWGRRNPKRKRT